MSGDVSKDIMPIVAIKSSDEELIEENENLSAVDLEDSELENKPISYPSINKVIKELKTSMYFDDYEAQEILDNLNELKEDMIMEIKGMNFPDGLSESMEMYQRVHELILDYMDNREFILNSELCMRAFRNFNVYREALREMRKPYLDKLAEENIRTVYFVVQKFKNNPIMSNDELVSVGMMGYAKALDSFSPVRNVKFSTFGINCIFNEIRFYLRKEKKHSTNNVSLETKLSTDKNGNDLVLGDTIPDRTLDPDEKLQAQDVQNTTYMALRELTPIERYILIYRFGLDRGIQMTQKDIAIKLDMSQANISKIEKNSLDKMKELLKNKHL